MADLLPSSRLLARLKVRLRWMFQGCSSRARLQISTALRSWPRWKYMRPRRSMASGFLEPSLKIRRKRMSSASCMAPRFKSHWARHMITDSTRAAMASTRWYPSKTALAPELLGSPSSLGAP